MQYLRLRSEFSANYNFAGDAETNFAALEELSKSGGSLDLLKPKGKGPDGQHFGRVFVRECCIIKKPSFVDYFRGGLQIKFLTAFDFTSSNGDPRSGDSLHYIDPQGQSLNPYEHAVRTVGSVLEVYDNDKVSFFSFYPSPSCAQILNTPLACSFSLASGSGRSSHEPVWPITILS